MGPLPLPLSDVAVINLCVISPRGSLSRERGECRSLSTWSRVISRYNIICDFHSPRREHKMRSRTSVSESRLGEWQTFQKMGAAQAPRAACPPWSMVGQRGKFWMSTAFSRKMTSSAPYRSSAHSRARSLTCCLPFYTLSEWRQRRAQLCPDQVDLYQSW